MKFRPRFSLKVLMLSVAAVGIFCAYHVNWIRQRHEFLERHAAVNAPHDLRLISSTNRIRYAIGTYNRMSEKSQFNFLWLFGEPRRNVITLAHKVDEEPTGFLGNAQLVEMLPKEEREFAERLFPEADFQIRILWDYEIPNRSQPSALR